jgi:hypothetical protein
MLDKARKKIIHFREKLIRKRESTL